MSVQKLTEAQRRVLSSLSDKYRMEPPGWRHSLPFLRMEQRGFCQSDLRYLPYPEQRRWYTRITPAGRAALQGEER